MSKFIDCPLYYRPFSINQKNFVYQRTRGSKVKTKQTYGAELNRSTSLITINYICSIHCCQYKYCEKNIIEKTKKFN